MPLNGDLTLLQAVGQALRPGGVVCFRDYGRFDLRHVGDLRSSDGSSTGACVRLSDHSFVRAGGTFRRYYGVEDVAVLAEGAGLAVVESRYCCVRLWNRKRGLQMDRVFVHAVLVKSEGAVR